MREKSSRLFGQLRPLLLILFTVSALFAASLLTEVDRPEPATPLERLVRAPAQEDEASQDSGAKSIWVSITGAVNKPGVFELSGGDIVQKLIDKAGGLAKDADLLFVAREINLARKLQDGEQLYIPTKQEQSLLPVEKKQAVDSDPGSVQKININTATTAELETLPGVGPSTAEKIIAARPYAKVEDLLNVKGIGEATFAKLKDIVTV